MVDLGVLSKLTWRNFDKLCIVLFCIVWKKCVRGDLWMIKLN